MLICIDRAAAQNCVCVPSRLLLKVAGMNAKGPVQRPGQAESCSQNRRSACLIVTDPVSTQY